MATGYTSMIGRGCTFAEFLMGCAKAFGANISMREDPLDKPIGKFKPDSHHRDGLLKAKANLFNLERMTEKEAELEAAKFNETARKNWENAQVKQHALNRLYEDMLAQVRNWKPPSPDHQELKKFMVSQIQESIRFDCGDKYPKPPMCSGEDWLSDKLKCARADVEYHAEQWAREQERVRKANEWNAKLIESLREES